MSSKVKNSAKKYRPTKKEKFVSNAIAKPKLWINVATDLEILKVRSQRAKIASSYQKFKISSACIVANTMAKVEKNINWSQSIIQKVLQYSDSIFTAWLEQIRQGKNFSLECFDPEFFIGSAKANVLIRKHLVLDASEDNSTFSNLLGSNDGIILHCNQSTFTIWESKKCFYIFTLNLTRMGFQTPLLGRSKDPKTLLTYAKKTASDLCNIYSLNVVNSKILKPLTELVHNKEKTVDSYANKIKLTKLEDNQSVHLADEIGRTEKHPKIQNEVLHVRSELHHANIQQQNTMMFSRDYMQVQLNNCGILSASKYVPNPQRILHTNIAAAIFQHYIPAYLWTKKILDKILEIGEKIFVNNKDLATDEDWTKKIYFPIKLGNKLIQIRFEKNIFGVISSPIANSVHLHHGIKKYFDDHDLGLLVGPQLVLIWQERGLFFMFDAKERNQKGNKWTRLNSITSGANSGSACVTWHSNATALAETFVANIAPKYRTESYRIVELLIQDISSNLNNFQNWVATCSNKWFIVGTKTICDFMKNKNISRSAIAICTGIAAIAHSSKKHESEWSTSDIDEILSKGMQLFEQTPAGGLFQIRDFNRSYILGNENIHTGVEENLVSGLISLQGKSKNGMTLDKGILQFFKSRQYGLFTHKDVSVAVWKGNDNFYYIFYPYENKMKSGQCKSPENFLQPRFGYASRFNKLSGLSVHLLEFLDLLARDEYSISAIIIVTGKLSDRPIFQHYQDYNKYGAILRPFRNIYEGHSIFGTRANRQTLANLIVALCLNHIKKSSNWTSEDLTDIFYMGDTILCKILAGFGECESADYELQWEDIVPIIGLNKFVFIRNPIEGVINFPELDNEFADEENENEELDEQEHYGESEDEENAKYVVRPAAKKSINVVSKDLKSIIQPWQHTNANYFEAVLETNFFKVSIWKNDNIYFLFDSKKKQNSTVQPNLDREEEMLLDEEYFEDELSSKGEDNYEIYINGPYVACFTNFDAFYNHIIDKIAPDQRNGKFILHELKLFSEPTVFQTHESHKTIFRPVNETHSIIRGSISKKKLKNGTDQSLSNCLLSLAFAMMTQMNKLNSHLIDTILKFGERFHHKCINAFKKHSREQQYFPSRIYLEDLSSIFAINNNTFSWNITARTSGNLNLAELKKAFGKFDTIENCFAIILDHKNFVNALWRREGNFYLFNPHGADPAGKIASKGLPSISRFRKIDNLIDFFVEKFSSILGPNLFVSYTINIKFSSIVPSEAALATTLKNSAKYSILPEYRQEMGRDVRTLSYLFSDEKYSLNLICLAALVYSKLNCVELWNSTIFAKIKTLASAIAEKSKPELSNSEITLDKINPSFITEDTLCHVYLEKCLQGPIECAQKSEAHGMSLKNSLLTFTTNSNDFLLTLPKIVFALWKQNNNLHAFGATPKEMFVLVSTEIHALCDEMIKKNSKVETHDDKNWYKLQSIQINTLPLRKTVFDGKYSFITNISKTISNTPYQLKTQYLQIEHEIEILYSKDLLNRHTFFGTKDFAPSLQAACVAAGAMTKLLNPIDWNQKTIEIILCAGINLYLHAKAVKEKEDFQIFDLNGTLHMFYGEFKIYITEPVKKSSEDKLFKYLNDILQKHNIAYILADSFNFALIRDGNFSFLYYPGSTKPFCDEFPACCSCLLKCWSTTELIAKLTDNFNIMKCANVYIGAISVQ